ncbi:MAG: hypothetical protein OXE96_09605 [Gemmatimonadetes bacterium]|nr:hypothetical protein [Gemmatimonadota bacterium]
MTLLPVLVLLLLVGGFCGWIYYRREFAVRSRVFLLAARLVAVGGVVALLWNPVVSTAPRGAPPARFVILDASASMAAQAADGSRIWDSATTRARSLAAGGARLLVVAGEVTAVDPDSLAGVRPDGAESVMAGAVRTAAEAGAREITLVTDRRISDPVATAAVARQLGVRLAVDTLAGAGDNLGLGRLVLPVSAESGEPVRGQVDVEGVTEADSVTVTVTVDGRPHSALRVAAPAGGGIGTASFSLGASLTPGAHRVTARIEGSDAFATDDERTRIVQVDPEETGVLLVSFAGDWEPRFLLPVLDQVTGLPVRGFVRTGPDRYHPMDASATGAAQAVDEAALARLLRRAEMVVAMGVDGAVADFLEAATTRTRGLVVFPLDGAGAALAGVATGGPLSGEWYLDEAPASPIAEETGRFVAGGLPPLTGILPVVDEGGGAALNVRLGGAGEPEAAMVLRRDGRRKAAVVLARGFWRWAFRDGTPRDHYRRLWAAVGGWMMADEPLAAGPGVSPVGSVLPRGVPTRWRGRGYEGEEVAVIVTDSVNAVVLDSAITVPGGSVFTTPPLPPGQYVYTVITEIAAGPDTVAAAEATAADTTGGVFDVETFTGDMLHRPLDPAELTVRTDAEGAPIEGSRPLRTWPLPYLVILVALCAEWIGRRRAGLR